MICHIAAVVANKGRRWNDDSCGTGNVAAWRKRSVLRLAFRAKCTGATRSDSSPPGRDRRGSGEIFLGSVARRGSWCQLFKPGAHDADGGSGKTAVGLVVARKSSIEAGQKKLVKNRRKKESQRMADSFAKAEKGSVGGERPTRGVWNAWNRKQDGWRERGKKTNGERRAAWTRTRVRGAA